MNVGLLKKVEPAFLGRNVTGDDIEREINDIRALPRQTFGPIILHPQDYFYAFVHGIPFGLVVNYPSGGGILQREMQVLFDVCEPVIIDLCMRHPRSATSYDKGESAIKWIREARRLIDAIEWDIRKVRLLYDFPLLDVPTIEVICRAARESGFKWIKTSTGVYSKTEVSDVLEIADIAHREGLMVKSAGGIRDLSDVREHLAAGADVIGTSSWRKIYEEVSSKKDG